MSESVKRKLDAGPLAQPKRVKTESIKDEIQALKAALRQSRLANQPLSLVPETSLGQQQPPVYFDPRLPSPSNSKLERRKHGFSFVEQGTYVKRAQKMRLAQLIESGGFKQPVLQDLDRKEASAMDVDLKEEQILQPDSQSKVCVEGKIPQVEWWDIPLLSGGAPVEKLIEKPDIVEEFQNSLSYSKGFDETQINKLIHNPAPLKPVGEVTNPAPLPVMLTEKERAKVRRLRNAAKLKEKQDQIALGLAPPHEDRCRFIVIFADFSSDSFEFHAIISS
jgi:U4/U6 small nuclear ribonucleoprotein PRP3